MLREHRGGMMEKHKHQWSYPHVVFEGRKRDRSEIGVVRYCACGVKEMAFTKAWGNVPRNYKIESFIR